MPIAAPLVGYEALAKSEQAPLDTQAYDENMFDTAQLLLARMQFMKRLKTKAEVIIAAKENL